MEMYSKLNKYFKYLEWICYFGLCGLAVSLTWQVVSKFLEKESSFIQSTKPISRTPTIALCFSSNSLDYTYGVDFNISIYPSYATYKKDISRMFSLDLNQDQDKILEIITSYAGKCYKVLPLENLNGLNTFQVITVNFNQEKHLSEQLPKLKVFITSEDNFFGIYFSYWMNGELLEFDINPNNYVAIDIKEEQYVYLQEKKDCSGDNNFLKCFEDKLVKSDFDRCPRKCLPFTPQNLNITTLPMCDVHNSTEFDCASLHSFMFLYNLSSAIDGQCKSNCKIIQYSGKQTFQEKSDTIALRYTYLAPALTIVHKEYLIYDTVGMIGSIGGTLGIFIGFSFSNTISNFVYYIQILIAKVVLHFSPNSFK